MVWRMRFILDTNANAKANAKANANAYARYNMFLKRTIYDRK
jgi:hypothetical protein